MSTKIFLFGLDNAGKTAITKYFKEGKFHGDLKPTKKFSIEDIILKDLDFVVWDAPGQVNLREIWGKGIPGTNILMFTLDTSDLERFKEAKEELDKVLDNLDTRGIPLVFLFHKIDLDNARKYMRKAREVMKLPLITERKVESVKTSVKSGEGMKKLEEILVDLVEKERWG